MRRAFLLAFLITGCGDNSSNNETDLATENPDFGGMDDLSVGSDLSNPPDLTSTGQDGNMVPDDGGTPQPIKWSARRFGGDHNGLAYGAGKFIAASSGSIIMTSTDGATWTPTLLPGGQDFMKTGFVNGQFYLIDYLNALSTSPDGVTWTPRMPTSTFVSLNGVAHNGTTWVAVGDKINSSTDLSSWTDTTPSGFTGTFNAVTTLGTTFVAVGDNGQAATSADGLAWTVGAMADTTSFHAVQCASGLCVAAGDDASIQTSTNGTSWTIRASNIVDTFTTLLAITRQGSTWVVVGDNGQIVTSPDGTTWTVQTSGVTTPTLSGVASSGTTLAAVGSTATRLSSTNGTTWTDHTFGYNLLGLATDGTTLVAAGGTEAVRSTDGTTFTAQTLAATVDNAAHAGGFFFAVGDLNGGAPVLFSSPDGTTWTRQINDDGSGRWVTGVAKGPTVYVAVGGDGSTPATWLSTGGNTTWTSQTLTGTANGSTFSSVIYAAGMFVATDNSGNIFTSTDGINWTDRMVPSNGGLSAVTYANSLFVAVGANSIAVSQDGMTWTLESDPSASNSYAVTYGSGQFLAVGNVPNAGDPAGIVTSTDAVNWVPQSGPINIALAGAVYFGGMFYASGDADLIIAGK